MHCAWTVHVWCTHGARMGRRHTKAGTCATVAVSYRPSGSPRARPRCFGTRSPRRCTPRRCTAAGSQCLGSQPPVRLPVWPPATPNAHLLVQGHPLGPKPRFGDCRFHCVWPTQARGRGGHACGRHAATLLRLLRRRRVHARPGRGMTRRVGTALPSGAGPTAELIPEQGGKRH